MSMIRDEYMERTGGDETNAAVALAFDVARNVEFPDESRRRYH